MSKQQVVAKITHLKCEIDLILSLGLNIRNTLAVKQYFINRISHYSNL